MSCAQGTKKTAAKLKLNLAGITNLSNGIGSGGAILFGKSSTGEQFGKLVSATEQDLEIPNGDWNFYAVMWENASTVNLKETVYCGKSAQKLSGTATTVAMSLSNSTCADADFSAGNHYTDGSSKVHFANFFMEECDELGKANSFTCLRDNQGSAVSYRMVFKSYRRPPGAPVILSDEVLYSQCVPVTGGTTIFSNGMGVNFPTSKSAMPFVVSAEMFLGSTDCGATVAETKGVFTQVFQQGLMGDSTPENTLVSSSGLICSTGPSTKAACENYLGFWSGSYCTLSDNIFAAFLPAAECAGSTSTASMKYIKQMVRIPKDYLCRNTSYALVGTDIFPGGNGTILRPYKICSEWQLNQIGEVGYTSAGHESSSFKLMNDLDMNNADFNVLARPSCVGASGSIYKKHHNLNPIGQVTLNGCQSGDIKSTGISFTGTFNGNFKTIAHGRIIVESSNVGFIRNIGSGGVVKNLNFVNLQVEGTSYVGGITGNMNGSNGIISNVTINGGHIESLGDNVGGVAGAMVSLNTISAVKVRDLSIKGQNKIGGLVGASVGTIEKSMFRGKIRQHTLLDGQIGGLVGEATVGSVINSSFSEGQIESSLKWIGGIAGTNAGTINNAYSNMFLLSRYGNNAFIGGIAGGNQSGAMTNVYSDGVHSYKGGGTPYTVDGISPFGSTATNCLSTSPIPVATSCTLKTAALMRQGTTSLSGLTEWKADAVTALPRLKWEFDINSRACLLSENLASVATQVTSGRGTFLLPVMVCTPDQLKDLPAIPAGKYVVLGEDINIGGWASADLISTFAGNLDGRRNSIYGLTISVSGTNNVGIFMNNTGAISNLDIVGNNFTHVNTGATGILAGVNSGVVKNIFLMGNAVQGINYVGSAAGSNSGTMDGIIINQGNVSGTTYVGGVAGSNEGVISHSSANVSVGDVNGSSVYYKIGGIAGFNGTSGIINQAVFGGNMNFFAASSTSPTYIGGIVGYNSGTLDNTMSKNYSQLNVRNSDGIGGLAGYNNTGAFIKKSLSLGKIIYQNAAVPNSANFHQIAGFDAGTTLDTFYLENNSAGFIGQAIATTCSASEMDLITAAPSYLTFASPLADLLEPSMYTNSGDILKTMIPFTVTSTNFVLNYSAGCVDGQSFSFYKSYDVTPFTGKRSIANFADFSNYTNFDMAYEANDPTLSQNIDRLYSYYKSKMYGTPPALTPPVWELEDGEYPRLLQIED